MHIVSPLADAPKCHKCHKCPNAPPEPNCILPHKAPREDAHESRLTGWAPCSSLNPSTKKMTRTAQSKYRPTPSGSGLPKGRLRRLDESRTSESIFPPWDKQLNGER